MAIRLTCDISYLPCFIVVNIW